MNMKIRLRRRRIIVLSSYHGDKNSDGDNTNMGKASEFGMMGSMRAHRIQLSSSIHIVLGGMRDGANNAHSPQPLISPEYGVITNNNDEEIFAIDGRISIYCQHCLWV